MEYFLGIDPGMTGGIVAIDGNARVIDAASFDNKNPLAIAQQLILKFEKSIIFIEDVHAMPGNGVVSMFNFGRSYGALIGLIYGLGRNVSLVKPQLWQKQLPPLPYDMSLGPKERVAEAVAYLGLSERLTVKKKPHQGLCDAYFIAKHALVTARQESLTVQSPVSPVDFKKTKRKTAMRI